MPILQRCVGLQTPQIHRQRQRNNKEWACVVCTISLTTLLTSPSHVFSSSSPSIRPSNSMSFSENLVMASFNCKALLIQSNTLFHRVFIDACNLKAPLSAALAFPAHSPFPSPSDSERTPPTTSCFLFLNFFHATEERLKWRHNLYNGCRRTSIVATFKPAFTATCNV